MEILWWLAPAGVTTVVAMLWVAWVGRPREEERDTSEEAYERFAAAMEREHPGVHYAKPPAYRDRSTGIAVRPSRKQDIETASALKPEDAAPVVVDLHDEPVVFVDDALSELDVRDTASA